MSKHAFIEWRLQGKTKVRVVQVQEIVDEYLAQGYRLTLRQLYYQFVARDLIANKEAEYRKLGNVVNKMRLPGLDWNAIEDRNRVPSVPSEWNDIPELVDTALRSFRLPRWEDQPHYCELWVEKAALAGVLEPMASEYHVTLMVNRGYSSQSAMYESARRILRNAVADGRGKPVTVFYLGDHDPSGQDMVRDIQDRLDMFTMNSLDLDVKCIALTTEQVEQYDPPPNPTKLSDSRAEGYIARHGHECWEVDALDPDTLQQLIRDEFEAVVDMRKMDKVKRREKKLKDELESVVEEHFGP